LIILIILALDIKKPIGKLLVTYRKMTNIQSN